MDLTPEDIEDIAVCFTIRERPLGKELLWVRRGVAKVSPQFLARYWIRVANEDAGVKQRLVSLFIEGYSKSGVPGQVVRCVHSPARGYPTEMPVLDYRHKAPKQVERRVRELFKVSKMEPPEKPKTQPPSAAEMASSFIGSMKNWAVSGFKTVDEHTLAARLEICGGCEFWDKSGFAGTGRCVKCGCATQAKLRLASEKCPVGKWKGVA